MSVVGYGDYRYELDDSWPNIPEGWTLGEGWAGTNPEGKGGVKEVPLIDANGLGWSGIGVTDVAADSNDRIYVFNRDKHPVIVFEAESGDFVTSWGEHEFLETHGIFVDSEDNVWTTDRQLHVVVKHTKYGEELLKLGEKGWSSASVSPHGMHPDHAFLANPFSMPAGVSVSSTGNIFVADGYGNRQVYKFNPNGEKELSWGSPGTGDGEFSLVHNLDIDSKDRIFVCDRHNDRMQIFDHDGNYIDSWTNLNFPGGVYCDRKNLVYIAEQGGLENGKPRDPGVSIFTESGELVSRFRGEYVEAHGMTLDSKGNIYTAELRKARGNSAKRVKKFVRIR